MAAENYLLPRVKREQDTHTGHLKLEKSSANDSKMTPSTFTSHISSNHHPSPYLRRFRLPSLNNSPTESYDDLLSPLNDQLPPCLLGNHPPPSLDPHTPLSAYQQTLSELERLKQKRSRLGSTSDYFSMASSFSSETSEDPWSPPSPAPAPALLPPYLTPPPATQHHQNPILLQISAETEALEKRNKQLNEGGMEVWDTHNLYGKSTGHKSK